MHGAGGTWTPDEARDRAAFVLGVAPEASTEVARDGYLRQLRAHAGGSEHARTARRTLMAAWAVWTRTAADVVDGREHGQQPDGVEEVIDLAAEDRRLAADRLATDRRRRGDRRRRPDRRRSAWRRATGRRATDRAVAGEGSGSDADGPLDEVVEVVEVVREARDGREVRVRHRVWQSAGSVLPGLPVDGVRVRRTYEPAPDDRRGEGADALA